MSDYTAEEHAERSKWVRKYGTQEMAGCEMLRTIKALEARVDGVREFCSQRQIPGTDPTIRMVCASILGLLGEPVKVKYVDVGGGIKAPVFE